MDTNLPRERDLCDGGALYTSTADVETCASDKASNSNQVNVFACSSQCLCSVCQYIPSSGFTSQSRC